MISAAPTAEGPAASLDAHLAQAPMSRTQWLIWALAAAGKWLEGLLVFSGGLVLPLLSEEVAPHPLQQAAVAAAGLLGILVGSLAFGGLADRWGRRPVFIAEMGLLLAGLLLAGLSFDLVSLLAGLLMVGLALGADYPTAQLMIAESSPAERRGRLVLGAFSCQALGVVCGHALAALLLRSVPQPDAWRLIYLLPILPVLLLAVLRRPLPESSHWLLSRGRRSEAERELSRLLERPGLRLHPLAPPAAQTSRSAPRIAALASLFSAPMRRATSLATVPWFLQDLGTYGIGIFLPMLLSGAVSDGAAATAGADPIAIGLSARGSLPVDLALLAGFAVAIAGTDRWGRMPLQITGFLGCAVGLLLAASAVGGSARSIQLPLGLVLFQFMTNLGPNAQSYLLAGEVFPTPIRGLGSGLAAAAGKLGAVLTALAVPLLLPACGERALLVLLAGTSLLGAAATWCFRIETTGQPLEDHEPQACGPA